jgi:SAM-dependent methyltransferase
MDVAYAAAYPDLYRHHWWWRVREEILLEQIRGILAGRRDARILDVGCGAALFFDALESFGRIEGIESDASAVEQSGKWRGRIVVGELDERFEPDAPFDLILMLDVLEHLPDPDLLLRRAATILAPAGHILATVPAFKWLWTAHDDLNHHLTRYTAGDLRRVFERAGLAPVKSGYLFQSLVVPKLLVRVKESMISRSIRVPQTPSPAINQAVQAWFRLEHRVAGWLPFGGSVLAVAVKDPPR